MATVGAIPCLGLFLSGAASATAPHFSLPKLVSANGYGAVVYANDRLSDFYPHLYQEYSPGVVTPDVLYDSYFGVVSASGSGWLNEGSTVGYVPASNLITVTRAAPNGTTLTEYAFAPMTSGGPALAQVATVTNTGSGTTESFTLVSLHNWHVGGTEDGWSPDATHVEERGSDVSVFLEAPGASGVSCSGVYDAVTAGTVPGGGCDTTADDVVPAFVYTIPALAPGESTTVGVYTTTTTGDGWVAGRSPAQWVADELSAWEGLLAPAVIPPGMDEEETAVYRQSLVFLRSAQVREVGDAFGQIAASLPVAAPVGGQDHIWNITWVRDASYAAAALAGAGYTDQAADLLRFLIQPGKTGDYRAYVGNVDYAVSVCRTYGDGSEWSDADANGPNIEFDDFGLYLWALGELAAAGRTDVVAELGPRALDGVADVLVGLVDPNTRLLYPDSSIWERHWNGHQQQFTFSSVQAVAGLRAAATIADTLGDTRGDGYRSTAMTLAQGIEAGLVSSSGVIAASAEQLATGGDYLDLAAVEAWNQGVLVSDSDSFATSIDAWQALRVESGNGYRRNDDGDTYDLQEWIYIDLRLAYAMRRAGRAEDAQALEDWVTAQAVLNHHTLPELYDPTTGDYAGPAPMLGFGAGAYVLNMLARTGGDDTGGQDDAASDTAGDTAGDPGGETDDDGFVPSVTGCQCTSAPGGARAAWTPLLPMGSGLLLLWSWRRARAAGPPRSAGPSRPGPRSRS